ncbi:hypothetical protein TREMEDRAFT_66174 [Tremella mesenterica DSM 1558]|uniref:uncharacterized protein n=1 Tax=Tremella mesenterica (strain ATCC 24925 / CBS 8224 / DSM 1558 / NBRC 9311 / NRRL Y-6157 / RJB 2259-6 / UBC 559-6) TaxID=578456 RepID=UPI00032BE445|nr:uncharacterized protein TREMEDRAFT_66174 [Tremella mesenterica DSM 1558]EIW65805.1 hypothetical protein TREMEDRAFT_66174 [Tremella mesenterica DSM 1558]
MTVVSGDILKPTHYLIVTYPAWSHLRSLLGLCNSLLILNPSLHLTILVPASRASAAALETSQYPPIVSPERKKIVHYGDASYKKDGLYGVREGYKMECLTWLESYTQPLAELDAVKDSITKEDVPLHDIPLTAIIADLNLCAFSVSIKKIMRREKGETPILLTLAPYNTALLAAFMMQGYGDLSGKIDRVLSSSGDDQELQKKLGMEIIGSSDEIVSIPGLSPYQSMLHRLPTMAQFLKYIPLVTERLIIGWPHVLGQNLQDQVTKRFGPSYQIGPQLPVLSGTEWVVEEREGECKQYLDAALIDEGENSVFFGSILFAPTKDQIILLLDVLEELQRKYIMVVGNLDPVVRPGVEDIMRDRVGRGDDKGLLVRWAPQRAILSHPATGLFLTHAGASSAVEAMTLRIPMILWPAGFDQPYIANELDALGVGYELLQIREGPNIGRPCARNGVVVRGTAEAIRGEFLLAFGDLKGGLVGRLRTRVGEVAELLREDRECGGTFKSMWELSRIGHEDLNEIDST